MAHLLTVFGATGQQGGALIAGVLKNPKLSKMYKLRAITRDVTKPAAVALKGKGVEVVRADMNDPESLKIAVAGSYAVFAVTNFWETAIAEDEIRQGKAMADASVAAGAELLIWASLPDVTKLTGGKLTNMYHFDSKAKVEEYIKTLPINGVFYWASMFMQNVQGIMAPKRNSDNTFTWAQPWTPTARLPMIDIADTGKYLTPILLSPPSKYNHKSLTCATGFYTSEEMVETWSRVTGKNVNFKQVDAMDLGDSVPEAIKLVMKDSSGLISDHSFYGPKGQEDVAWMLGEMEDKPTTWEEFLKREGPWFVDGSDQKEMNWGDK